MLYPTLARAEKRVGESYLAIGGEGQESFAISVTNIHHVHTLQALYFHHPRTLPSFVQFAYWHPSVQTDTLSSGSFPPSPPASARNMFQFGVLGKISPSIHSDQIDCLAFVGQLEAHRHEPTSS